MTLTAWPQSQRNRFFLCCVRRLTFQSSSISEISSFAPKCLLMNVITSGLKKAARTPKYRFMLPKSHDYWKKMWPTKCEISQSGWKFKLGPGVGVKCSISEFSAPEQDTTIRVWFWRWRSFGVGIGDFSYKTEKKLEVLGFLLSVKLKRFMGLSMKVKIQRKCRKWLRNPRHQVWPFRSHTPEHRSTP